MSVVENAKQQLRNRMLETGNLVVGDAVDLLLEIAAVRVD